MNILTKICEDKEVQNIYLQIFAIGYALNMLKVLDSAVFDYMLKTCQVLHALLNHDTCRQFNICQVKNVEQF